MLSFLSHRAHHPHPLLLLPLFLHYHLLLLCRSHEPMLRLLVNLPLSLSWLHFPHPPRHYHSHPLLLLLHPWGVESITRWNTMKMKWPSAWTWWWMMDFHRGKCMLFTQTFLLLQSDLARNATLKAPTALSSVLALWAPRIWHTYKNRCCMTGLCNAQTIFSPWLSVPSLQCGHFLCRTLTPCLLSAYCFLYRCLLEQKVLEIAELDGRHFAQPPSRQWFADFLCEIKDKEIVRRIENVKVEVKNILERLSQ